jgi:hypothetical protein
MAYGSGGSDYEQRILNLERMLNTPRLASVEQRLGAVEQTQWQTANPGGGLGVMRATTAASIASGNSGDVTLADGTTVQAFLWLSGTVASGTKVYIDYVAGQFDIVQVDC